MIAFMGSYMNNILPMEGAAIAAFLAVIILLDVGADWPLWRKALVGARTLAEKLAPMRRCRVVTGLAMDSAGYDRLHDLTLLDPKLVGGRLAGKVCRTAVTLLAELDSDAGATVTLTGAALAGDDGVESVYWTIQASDGRMWTGVTDSNGDSSVQAWRPVETKSSFVFADDTAEAMVSPTL